MKKVVAVLIIAGFILSSVSIAFAAEEEKNPAEKAATYTGNVVSGSVNTVGEATKETTETAVSPLVALWRSLTGKGKPEKVVTDPINKGGETVYNATVNTGKTIVGEKK